MKTWFKNISGFIINLFKRLMPASIQSKDLSKVFNYHDIEDLFTTSGQPNAYQLKLIAENGYDAVINLAPKSVFEGSVISEADITYEISSIVAFSSPCKDFNDDPTI